MFSFNAKRLIYAKFNSIIVFYSNYGHQSLDELLTNWHCNSMWNNNTAPQRANWRMGDVCEWLTIDTFLARAAVQNYGRKWCKWWPGEAKTLWKKAVPWESDWQWIKMRAQTMERGLLTTFTASTRCLCVCVRKKKYSTCGLIIWTSELLEPRLRAHLDVKKAPIRQIWEVEL